MELTIEQALQQGIAAHKEGKVQEAERLYRAIIQSQPLHPDANHNLGVLAVSVNKTDAALPLFKKALESNPKIEQFWISYVDALIKEKQFDNAKKVLEQAKNQGVGGERLSSLEKKLVPISQKQNTGRVRPPQEQLTSLLGHYQNGRFSDAEKLSNSIIHAYPSHNFSWKILAQVFKATGRNSESINAHQTAVALSPQDAEARRNLGITLKELGRLGEAEASFTQAIALKPDYVEAHRNLGSTLHKLGRLDEAEASYTKAIALKPYYAAAHYNLGITLQELGSLDKAEASYTQAIALKPDYAEAHSNLGNTIKELGRLDEAEVRFKQAIAFKPDYAEAHYNLGVTLKELGRLDEAKASYTQAIVLKPDFAECHSNLGNVLKELGGLEEAEASYTQAIVLKPDYALAHNNLGSTLKELGRLDEAEASYTQAIALKPDFAEAHSNLGVTLTEQGRLEESEASFAQAIALKPDYAEAYSNLGNTLTGQGKLKEAIQVYNKAISIQPESSRDWNNIFFPLQAIKTELSSREELISYYPESTNSKYAEIAKSILNYRLNQGRQNVESSVNETLSLLATAENIAIKNPESDTTSAGLDPVFPEKITALVHFGRSGTGLLHSLIDGHPEVSTLTSIYFSEYFDHSTWDKIISGGWSEMASRFMAIYEVLFNASSTVPVHGLNKNLIYNIGRDEGMTNVGDQRGEVLSVDKTLFCSELNRLMNYYDELDASTFFTLVHAAYDKTINDLNHKSVIFYHIHNPDVYSRLNFVRSAPNANWVMMVREPVQSCESWLRNDFQEKSYEKIVSKIVTMLFEIDNVVYRKQSSIGLRLEDLKEYPRKTIPALCNWMGIKETENLYEMTAQGKKWWGDPASPDYLVDGMDPFGNTSIKRKVGSIFSESDRFIIRTLFYPFSVKFGYADENSEQFTTDLNAIRPMLDQTFDFEDTIVERTHAHPEQFMKAGSYLYLRSGLIERWNVLNEFKTYPNMIKRLEI